MPNSGAESLKGECVERIKKIYLNMFVEKLFKILSLDNSTTPVLYIGCKLPKG
jgi:hypothetical protein